MKEKIKAFLVTAVKFILNPRLLLCFGIGWMITNGWSYLMFGIGVYLEVTWMIAVSSAYLAWLWLPVSPEKIVTLAIAIWLLKLLFPKDQNTLAVLQKLYQKARSAIKSHKQKKGD